MNQSTTIANLPANGLELVREVLFGAEKRQSTEELSNLKAQLAESNERFRQQVAQMERAHGDALKAMQTASAQKLAAMDSEIAANRQRSKEALDQLTATMNSQFSALSQAALADRTEQRELQARYIQQMRAALDVLEAGTKTAK